MKKLLTTLIQMLALTVLLSACSSGGEGGGNAPTVSTPTVTTTTITDITATTATGGGNVTADGGAAVTARGICWGMAANPTIGGSHTTNGTGTGAFISAMTGLTQNTIYHVRAYATNSAGTAYGDDRTFTTATTPAAGWHDISSAVTAAGTSNFIDVHFVDENNGLVSSGNVSEVYVTTDGGTSFTTRSVAAGTFMNSIHMISSTEFYAGAQNNRIYRSTNSGADWTSLGVTGNPVRSITFPPSSTTGYSAGDTGTSYSITSGGITNLPTSLSTNLKSVSFPTVAEGWICGGAIIRHFTGGVWTGDQTYPANGYNGISFVNNTTGWAVGDNGVIIHTTDGKNWSPQTNPDTHLPQRTLNDVFFLNASEGWAVGDGGIILHTTNGGTAWAIEADGLTTNLLTSVYFTSSTNGYVAGINKTLLRFSNEGAPSLKDWSARIPNAGSITLSDVQAIGNTVWISSSGSNEIFRSTDKGLTFTAVATASVTQSLHMRNTSDGWAVGLAKGSSTTDGGVTWSNPNTTIGGTLYDVYFPSSLIGYAVGNSGYVRRTSDGGTSWTTMTQPLNASILSVAFPDSSNPNTGYVAISNAITTIYKTTDGGTTWNYNTLPGITSSMNCLKFIDANTGFAAGGNGEIFAYKSGTWTKQTSPVTTSLNGISFTSDGLNGWAVGDGGVMLHTTDGGTIWTQVGVGLTTQNLKNVEAVSGTEAHIVGYGKTYIKFTNQ